MNSPVGKAMWILFAGSFENQVVVSLHREKSEAKTIRREAKERYEAILKKLPEFEKGDRFLSNIVSCAMLCAFLLSLKERPSLDEVTVYYREAMSTSAMKLFCRLSGKRKFSDADVRSMRETEKFNAAVRNPYSWNMEFYPYEDNSGYEARFTHCGICVLMKEYGLGEYIPAMCRLDYAMAEMGGASRFVRQYTLAEGGPYCDCGYHKRG